MFRKRWYRYLGKVEDGWFYHVVEYVSTIHVYVRRKTSRGWVTERVYPGKISLEQLPKTVREYVTKFLQKVRKTVTQVTYVIKNQVTKIIEHLEFLKDVLYTVVDVVKTCPRCGPRITKSILMRWELETGDVESEIINSIQSVEKFLTNLQQLT